MARCLWCRREMTSGATCTVRALHQAGRACVLAPSRYRCGDCGVARGGLHHLGCDMQPCPCCGGQLISCGCRFDEDEDDDE